MAVLPVMQGGLPLMIDGLPAMAEDPCTCCGGGVVVPCPTPCPNCLACLDAINGILLAFTGTASGSCVVGLRTNTYLSIDGAYAMATLLSSTSTSKTFYWGNPANTCPAFGPQWYEAVDSGNPTPQKVYLGYLEGTVSCTGSNMTVSFNTGESLRCDPGWTTGVWVGFPQVTAFGGTVAYGALCTDGDPISSSNSWVDDCGTTWSISKSVKVIG